MPQGALQPRPAQLEDDSSEAIKGATDGAGVWTVRIRLEVVAEVCEGPRKYGGITRVLDRHDRGFAHTLAAPPGLRNQPAHIVYSGDVGVLRRSPLNGHAHRVTSRLAPESERRRDHGRTGVGCRRYPARVYPRNLRSAAGVGGRTCAN